MDDGARVAAPRHDGPMTATPTPVPFWERARELFHACAPLDAAERKELLDRECNDPELREEVESLLAEHDKAGDFLDRSVWDLAREVPVPADLANIGPYRVLRRIGEGGMGTVLLAVRDDAQFEQRVAIKIVRAAGGDVIVQRFRRERQILAALAHPNIARLLDGGTTATGVPYLVMEYVEGTPIDEYSREQDLPIAARLRLFLALCDAVQYAHRNLIIHRDIKPSNVLVTADGVPKLLDFGIAKLSSDEVRPDATATRLMTPEYASPEQLDGQIVTTASDVYSLGVLLFELLTGKKPFGGATRGDAPRASSIARSSALKGDLDLILGVALDPDPERRYGSVENFAADIRRHLEGRPVSVRGGSFVYYTSKFVRRNKLFAIAAGVALAAIVIAFVAVLQQKRIAERRFEQVRSLAHSVVFDIHDAIAPLRGSTNARRLLVQRALVYLDALAKESGDNTPLEMELAGAYERIGDVQGMPYRPNLGDGAAALTSYRKAIAIAERVREREPENRALLSLLAELHDRAGLVEQRGLRFHDSLADHEKARELRDLIPNRGTAGDLAQARTWVGIADSVYLSSGINPVKHRATVRGGYEMALRILERIPPNDPNRAELLVSLARTHQRLGAYFTGTWEYEPHLAMQHHEAALRALDERMNLDPTDSVARRNWADHLVMMATLQNRVKDGQAAVAGVTRGLAVFRELAAADPDNVEAKHDVAFAYETLGTAYGVLEKWDAANESYAEALRIREELVQADPNNREDRRGMAGIYGALANAARRRGDVETGRMYQAKSEEVFRALKR